MIYSVLYKQALIKNIFTKPETPSLTFRRLPMFLTCVMRLRQSSFRSQYPLRNVCSPMQNVGRSVNGILELF